VSSQEGVDLSESGLSSKGVGSEKEGLIESSEDSTGVEPAVRGEGSQAGEAEGKKMRGEERRGC